VGLKLVPYWMEGVLELLVFDRSSPNFFFFFFFFLVLFFRAGDRTQGLVLPR